MIFFVTQLFNGTVQLTFIVQVKEFLYLGNFVESTDGWARNPGSSGQGSSADLAKKGGGAGATKEAISFDTVMELLNISNQFMLERMKETLENLLLRQYLDFDNFVSLLITAENYSCYNLKRELFEFARRNFITLLMGNVARELLDATYEDCAYLLDDLQYFVQSGGKLREDEGEEEGENTDEHTNEQQEIDDNELLSYFSEEEVQRQKEMEAFWDQERQIAKERENARANEQRRRMVKARAKTKARARNRLRASRGSNPSTTATPENTESSAHEAATHSLSTEEIEEREKSRAQLRMTIETATAALAKDYQGNEGAIHLLKRLRAVRKKLNQIYSLKLKQDEVFFPT